MKLNHQKMCDCDVLVIGGGGAGFRSAIAARAKDADVLMVSKSRLGHATNTYISKSIIAASGWGCAEDNDTVHMTDTITGGRFLNDQAKVATLTRRVGAEVTFLRECGVSLAMADGKPQVVHIPGHLYPRHVYGENWTGSDLVSPLKHRAEQAGVRFLENVFVTRLLSADGRITGATGLSVDGQFHAVRAKAVVLATGGYAQIYLNTNNAAGITGDGLALAYEVGGALQDMEFVQFYPTAMGRRGNRLLLYEKMLAQTGVVLKNGDGQDILLKNGFSDPTKVTRDQLAQLVIKEIRADTRGATHMTMDLSALSAETASQLRQLLPAAYWKGQRNYAVAPTTHFCMGGVATDQDGETSVGGLFAIGEVSAGAHGANRLGGNALAEVFALGSLGGEKAAESAQQTGSLPSVDDAVDQEKNRLEGEFSPGGVSPRQLTRALKTLMWEKVGIIRGKSELEAALARIQGDWPEAAIGNSADLIRLLEFRNMRLVAEMVCRAALERTETRGSHFRVDYPAEDNEHWLKNIVLRKGDTGTEVESVNVVQSRVKLA